MDDELIDWKAADTGFGLLGLAVCGAALFASGGLAILAGAVALACLAGSVAVSLIPSEAPCERYARECEEAGTVSLAPEPAISPSQETGHGHHWRQSVAASRCGRRSR